VVTYTLQLVDNTKDLRQAVDNLRRVNVQLSAKFIGNHQMRAGIYDLLQKVRGKGKAPITSNLPSENFALGIGSTRLAGTGRTAGIKAKKMEQKGMAESAAQAQNYLVGGSRQSGDGDLMFLKNAMGHEMQFTVERGGGARAQLLATARRRRRKLMDAAASRVGATLPLYVRVEESRKRKAEEEKEAQKQGKKPKAALTLEFLKDNIGRQERDSSIDDETLRADEGEELESSDGEEPALVLADDLAEMLQLSEENRIAAYQAQYKSEMDRQVNLLNIHEAEPPSSPRRMSLVEDDERSVAWEDGDGL